MDENEIKQATGRDRNQARVTPFRSEQEETEERVRQEMEILRQQQRPARPMPRREDLPRPIAAEDLLTSLNTRPANTPTSPSQAQRINPPVGNPSTPARLYASPGPGSCAATTPGPGGTGQSGPNCRLRDVCHQPFRAHRGRFRAVRRPGCLPALQR